MPDVTALTVGGKLVSILPKEEGEGRNGHWQRQSFVIEIQRGTYATSVCFDAWGDQVNVVASLRVGDMLTVFFDPSSREFNGRWYTSLRAWRITVGAGATDAVDRPSTIGVVDAQSQQNNGSVQRVDTSSAYQNENDDVTGRGDNLPF